MASYPTSIPSFDDQQDGIDVVNAADVNLAYDEIEAIATELGVNASIRSAPWSSLAYNTSITDFGDVGSRIKNVEDGVQDITGRAITTTGNRTITVTSNSDINLVLKAKSGQTSNLMEFRPSGSNTPVTEINASGYIVSIDGGSA